MIHVLVASGEKASRESLSSSLARAGFAVQEVETGLAALSVMASSSHRPVVVLDDPLPDLDGLVVVRFAVAALHADWHASIVLVRSEPLSREAQPARRERGAETPVALITPFGADTLVAAVRSAATHRCPSAQREAREPRRTIQTRQRMRAG